MNHNDISVIVESRSSVVRPADGSVGIIQYPSMVRLSDGTLLATYENYGWKYIIHRSLDDGITWERFSTVTDTLNVGYVAEWMPHLYELPVDMGDYKAGTVILAGTSKNQKDTFDISTITLHASTDKGATWSTVCNVDIGGGGGWGVWEPFLIYEEERGRLYCFYSDDSAFAVGQKLVYKYTTDLKNWVGKDGQIGVECEPKDAVECADHNLRPGMISIAKMGNGEYIMTYEVDRLRVLPVFCKKTFDLDDWGDINDYGTQVISTDGRSFGASPWCAWSPCGGECGTLVVVGKHPAPYYHTEAGAKMLVSFDYGKSFTALDNPIPYPLRAKETHCGYSPCLFFSPDGEILYYVGNTLIPTEKCHEIVLKKIRIENKLLKAKEN